MGSTSMQSLTLITLMVFDEISHCKSICAMPNGWPVHLCNTDHYVDSHI